MNMIQQKIGGFNKQKGKLESGWRVYNLVHNGNK